MSSHNSNNSQVLEAILTSTNSGMAKLGCIHTTQNYQAIKMNSSYKRINDFQKHREWKKPDTKEYRFI